MKNIEILYNEGSDLKIKNFIRLIQYQDVIYAFTEKQTNHIETTVHHALWCLSIENKTIRFASNESPYLISEIINTTESNIQWKKGKQTFDVRIILDETEIKTIINTVFELIKIENNKVLIRNQHDSWVNYDNDMYLEPYRNVDTKYTFDQILDIINEKGGYDKLSPTEKLCLSLLTQKENNNVL